MQAWFIFESISGSYYHTILPTEIGGWPVVDREAKALWTFYSQDAARIAARSLNQQRMARRTAAGLHFSYCDGDRRVDNGL